jgi:hypothetical protein
MSCPILTIFILSCPHLLGSELTVSWLVQIFQSLSGPVLSTFSMPAMPCPVLSTSIKGHILSCPHISQPIISCPAPHLSLPNMPCPVLSAYIIA